MNIPYGCVMVAVNESLKRAIRPAGDYDTQTFLLAGSGAGAIAAVATNPLDVVKTRLQTQAIKTSADTASAAAGAGAGVEGAGLKGGGVALPQFLRAGGGAAGGGGQHPQGFPSGFGPVLGSGQGTGIHSAAVRCPTGRCGVEKPVVTLQYQGLLDAVRFGKALLVAELFRCKLCWWLDIIFFHLSFGRLSWKAKIREGFYTV